jgi:REP element-mobilizing transposase RayT
MGHAHHSILVHCVFSTKQRRKLIAPVLRERLWPFLGGIARKNGYHALAIGGTDDHVHLLLSLPTTMSIAKAVQLIKGGSSKWIHDTFPEFREFAWQDGYGAFTIDKSGVAETIAYINRQEEHHRTVRFDQEFEAFLRRHDINFDPRLPNE